MTHLNHFSKLFAVSVLASVLVLTGCNDDNDDYHFNESAQNLATNTENYAPEQTQANTTVSQTITYKMPAINGGETKATAVVMIPKGTMPSSGWPIVAWAHGTTGVADRCAPSKLKNADGLFDLGGNLSLVNLLLSEGYAVVAPDYEGLGTDGIHPFLNAQSEGESIIYAVRAAKQQYRTQLADQWAVVGHSQGGHAAIAAAERASEATGMSFKGVLAYAPASHLKEIFGMGQATAGEYLNQGDLPKAISTLASIETFSALVTAGVKQTLPNLKYTDVFGARSAPIAEKAENVLCSGELGQTFGADIQSYFQTNGITNPYPGLISNFDEVPEIKTFLAASVIGDKTINQPIVVVQGDIDPTVPIDATRALEQQIKAKNSTNTNIQFNYVTGKNHITVITEGTNYLVNFLNQYMPAK